MPKPLGAIAPDPTLLEDNPAPRGAGGAQMDQRRRCGPQQHLEAADLETRLVVLLGMYKTLLKRGVGTNLIKSETMRMTKEWIAGPTGHQLLDVSVKGGDDECCEPARMDAPEKSLDQICWRDPKLVQKNSGVSGLSLLNSGRQGRFWQRR